jgi:amino acid permease
MVFLSIFSVLIWLNYFDLESFKEGEYIVSSYKNGVISV